MSKHHILTKEIITPIGQMLAAAVEDGVFFLEFAEKLTLGFDLEKAAEEIGGTFQRGPAGGMDGSMGIENSGTAGRDNFRHQDIRRIRHLEQLDAELKEYFSGNRRVFAVPLVLAGTAFQKKAWEVLLKIPYGTVLSYSLQAMKLGNAKAVRAVGNANAKNRIAIVVPCHRVISKNNTLGGYTGGLWRKKYLLKLEGAINFPKKHGSLEKLSFP